MLPSFRVWQMGIRTDTALDGPQPLLTCYRGTRSTGTLSRRERHVIAWLPTFNLGLGPGRYLG
jgi:hypothetical protein